MKQHIAHTCVYVVKLRRPVLCRLTQWYQLFQVWFDPSLTWNYSDYPTSSTRLRASDIWTPFMGVMNKYSMVQNQNKHFVSLFHDLPKYTNCRFHGDDLWIDYSLDILSYDIVINLSLTSVSRSWHQRCYYSTNHSNGGNKIMWCTKGTNIILVHNVYICIHIYTYVQSIYKHRMILTEITTSLPGIFLLTKFDRLITEPSQTHPKTSQKNIKPFGTGVRSYVCVFCQLQRTTLGTKSHDQD